MNGRVDPVPLTVEDLDIWVLRALDQSGHRTPGWLRLDAQKSDRRDAKLMLQLFEGGCPICLGHYVHDPHCEWFWSGLRIAIQSS